MSKELLLNQDQMQTFVNVLDNLNTTDIIIKDGLIRQYNDDKTIIFNIELPFLKGFDINLTKSYIDIFKVFIPEEENDETKLIVDDTRIVLEYDDSILSLIQPLEKYMLAQFIPEEKFKLISEGDVLQDIHLTPAKLNRIKVVGKKFATDTIELHVKGDKIELRIDSTSNTKSFKATEVKNEALEEGIYISSFNAFNFPFDDDPDIKIIDVVNKPFYALEITSNTYTLFSILRQK